MENSLHNIFHPTFGNPSTSATVIVREMRDRRRITDFVSEVRRLFPNKVAETQLRACYDGEPRGNAASVVLDLFAFAGGTPPQLLAVLRRLELEESFRSFSLEAGLPIPSSSSPSGQRSFVDEEDVPLQKYLVIGRKAGQPIEVFRRKDKEGKDRPFTATKDAQNFLSRRAADPNLAGYQFAILFLLSQVEKKSAEIKMTSNACVEGEAEEEEMGDDEVPATVTMNRAPTRPDKESELTITVGGKTKKITAAKKNFHAYYVIQRTTQTDTYEVCEIPDTMAPITDEEANERLAEIEGANEEPGLEYVVYVNLSNSLEKNKKVAVKQTAFVAAPAVPAAPKKNK